jgi:uncharacterized membrane protein (DUF4010 family)
MRGGGVVRTTRFSMTFALTGQPDQNIPELTGAARLAIAALVGLAVGIEREWSGHASGPQARFAGVRTFMLLGLIGGGAGLLFAWQYPLAGVALLASGGVFVVLAYVMATRREGSEPDGTTEGAALVVLTLGTLAGIGELALASGAVAVVVLALREKERVHWFVRHIGEREMRAGGLFLVLALVILPLLPEGPYGPFGGVRPRTLWTIVVLFSGLNFIGYLARRAVGPERGYGVTGMLGGIVSSTAVTLQFSRASHREPELSRALAFGAIAASVVVIPRVAVLSAVLNPAVARAVALYLLPAGIVGLAMIAIALRRPPRVGAAGEAEDETQSPLRLWSAIQMAVLFQLAITVIAATRQFWGSTGVFASAALFGLTDVDALTVSMSRLGDSPQAVALAAQGITVGLLSNTLFKLAAGLLLGSGRFRVAIASGLGLLAAVIGLGLWLGGRA